MEQLASRIDRVEKHLDTYGTIVVKSPDVWGEARLTKYRADVESVLVSKRSSFTPTLSAAISRTDQAFLASSLALQAALGGTQAALISPTDRVGTVVTESFQVSSSGQLILGPDGKPVPIKTSTPTVIADETLTDQSPPTATAAPSDGFTFSRTNLVHASKPEGLGGEIGLEPTVVNNQLARYLNHLNQLRRTNDGDDLSDSPGYALHLVRIPVSVLPGKNTREGYGAEVTISVKPHLHDKLLPETFRGLVINDIVDQLRFPLARLIDLPNAADLIDRLVNFEARTKQKEELLARLAERRKLLEQIEQDSTTLLAQAQKSGLKLSDDTRSTLARGRVSSRSLASATAEIQGELANSTEVNDEMSREIKVLNRSIQDMRSRVDVIDQQIGQELRNLRLATGVQQAVSASGDAGSSITEDPEEAIRNEIQRIEAELKTVERSLELPSIPITPSRRSQQPYEPSQLLEVYGRPGYGAIAQSLLTLKSDPHNGRAALLLDVQRILSERINSAYLLLLQRQELWSHCTPYLAQAIRNHDVELVASSREAFQTQLQPLTKKNPAIVELAWGIVAESALLNERLIEDMRLMQTAKNCHCLTTDWMEFFRPEPAPEAVLAFNQYVECRWPVHIFAIDPETDDQNVSDAFSQRREMQLALSLAFVSGQINAQKFMRYARNMELDIETIALNRTAVGFSHGDDTFGWRFYPRVQTPPSRGNLAVVTREMLIGGFKEDQLLRTRRLEPGIRNCTAIMLLPGFVPYAIFDFRTNWFKLTNPAKREFNLKESVQISEEITSLRQLAQVCVNDDACYRPSEAYRLTRAVEQIERRVPLQTSYVQLPFENPLGGFEFFNGGAPDLAPELHGFYGEPGISAVENRESTLFLVGDNFSVHETNVIVGNNLIVPEKMKLISRQVLQVTVKAPVGSVSDSVDVHVATPYGVSNHLLVPLVPSPEAEAQKAASTVSQHEAKFHLDRFAWKSTPAPTVLVRLDDGNEIESLKLALKDRDEKLQVIATGVPAPQLHQVFDASTMQLAAWLTIKSADGAKPPVQKAIGPWKVGKDGTVELKSLVEDKKFLTVLQSLEHGYHPSEVEFAGFVRIPDASGLPTVRLDNSFKLSLVLIEPAQP